MKRISRPPVLFLQLGIARRYLNSSPPCAWPMGGCTCSEEMLKFQWSVPPMSSNSAEVPAGVWCVDACALAGAACHELQLHMRQPYHCGCWATCLCSSAIALLSRYALTWARPARGPHPALLRSPSAG